MAERALRLFLEPLVEAAQVVEVHTLDLPYPLALLNAVETNRTVLVLERSKEPVDFALVGLLVLLEVEVLVGQAQQEVEEVVEN